MLWTIFVALLLLWFLGFSLHVGGILIYLLLVIALTVLIIDLRGGIRSAVSETTPDPLYYTPSSPDDALRSDGLSDVHASGQQEWIHAGDDRDA
jgi:uncharacterized protein DUF5670